MRKLIVCNAMSLDGYYSGPDDNVMLLEPDPAFDEYNAERLRDPTRSFWVASRTWSKLLADGLVDELHLMVGSVVVGNGTPMFTEPTASPGTCSFATASSARKREPEEGRTQCAR